jgi:hypothetical protein
MRKLVLQMGVSVDGFLAALDGAHPWREACTYPTGAAIHVYRPRSAT